MAEAEGFDLREFDDDEELKRLLTRAWTVLDELADHSDRLSVFSFIRVQTQPGQCQWLVSQALPEDLAARAESLRDSQTALLQLLPQYQPAEVLASFLALLPPFQATEILVEVLGRLLCSWQGARTTVEALFPSGDTADLTGEEVELLDVQRQALYYHLQEAQGEHDPKACVWPLMLGKQQTKSLAARDKREDDDE
jgi:hypothetical protein